MSGRAALLSVLADEGVEFLFGNPGTTELSIMEALAQQADIAYVLGLQESAVVAMADGYARASGRLGVCNVHVAPGLGNAMGSLYNAKWYGSPMIVTAGQQPQGTGVMDPPLYDALVPMAAPMVKWAFEPTRPDDVPRVMRRAAKIALTPPTGPVFVSLPSDVLEGEAEIELGGSTRIDVSTRPSDAALGRLADRLLAARNPLLLAGHELSTRDAWAEAAALAEVLGAPVYRQTFAYSAQFPAEHMCFMGTLSAVHAKARAVLEQHDLLVCLGSDVLRMASLPSSVDPLPPGMPIVHLSERDWELGKNYATELALRANVKETLAALLPVLRTRRSADQAAQVPQRLAEVRARNWSTQRTRLRQVTAEAAQRRPIAPPFLMMQIAEALPPNAVVVEEAIASGPSLLGFLASPDPRSFFGLASGGIGFAVAGAVGISLASPGRPVLAVIGDGSAMYNIQALWTAAHLKLPITYVIVNNGGYRILKERMQQRWPDAVPLGMDLTEPCIDFVAMARSMGISAHRIERPEQLCDSLRDSLAAGAPRLLEVMVADRG